MSTSTTNAPKYLRRCKRCRKIIDTDLFDDHVRDCGKSSNSNQNDDNVPAPKSNSQSQVEDISETLQNCHVCGKICKVNTILKHLTNSKYCEKEYPTKMLEDLKKKCSSSKQLKSRQWNNRRTGMETSKFKQEETYLEKITRKRKQTLDFPVGRYRPIQPPVLEFIACLVCDKSFPINGILKHLEKMKPCKDNYPSQDLQRLRQKCKDHVRTTRNFSRIQKNVEFRRFEFSMDQYEQQLQRYKTIKIKIEEWYLKCADAIDLSKVFHYKWEIQRVEKSKFKDLRVMHRRMFDRQQAKLDQLVIKLDDHVGDTIKEIKGSTAKWCFDNNVHNGIDRQIADLNYIKSKCQELLTKTLADFDFELTNILSSLRRLFSSVGSKMETFETSEQDPDLATYNRKRFLANRKAEFSYYAKEITEMTKRYVQSLAVNYKFLLPRIQFFRLFEKGIMDCEAMLHQQWEKEEQRFSDSNQIVDRYATKLGQNEISEMRWKLNECRIKQLRIESEEKQEKLTSNLKQLCDSSKIELGVTSQQALTRYRDYRKRLIILKTSFDQHCDLFTREIEMNLEEIDSEFEGIFVSSEKKVKDRKHEHKFHGFRRLS